LLDVLFVCVCCQVIAIADNARADPSGLVEALSTAQEQVANLQKQLAESEVMRRGLDRDILGLKRQLVEEQAERTTLEDHLAQYLEDAGDDMAQVGPCPALGCCCCGRLSIEDLES